METKETGPITNLSNQVELAELRCHFSDPSVLAAARVIQAGNSLTYSASISRMAGTPSKKSFWGAGSLKSALKIGVFSFGPESASMRNKLAVIRSLFPHKDLSPEPRILEIYHDTLDILRFESPYNGATKKFALQCLLEQIRCRQVHFLKRALQERTLDEIRDVMDDIFLICMDELESLYDKLHLEGKNAVLVTSRPQARILLSVLVMTAQMTKQNAFICRAIIKTKLLDILLRISIIFPAFSQSSLDGAEPWLSLLNACRLNLQILFNSGADPHPILNHPVCAIWRACVPVPPPPTSGMGSEDHIFSARAKAWRRAPKACVTRRVRMIYINALWNTNTDDTESMEACADTVEFIRYEHYEPDTVKTAYLAILKHIITSGGSAIHLIATIARQTYEDIVHIFSGIFRLWIMISEFLAQAIRDVSWQHMADDLHAYRKVVGVATPQVVVGFYQLEKHALFQEVSGRELPGRNMLEFSIQASRREPSICRGILHAGGLSLILMAFTNREFRPVGLVDGDHALPNMLDQRYPTTAPIPIPVINDEAATLTVLMHDIHFRSTWAERPLRLRRALCSQLLNELMSVAFDDRHTWARALFLKILAYPT